MYNILFPKCDFRTDYSEILVDNYDVGDDKTLSTIKIMTNVVGKEPLRFSVVVENEVEWKLYFDFYLFGGK